MDDTEVRITLRLPGSLRDRLLEAADKNSRSMNGEIVARLEWTLTAHPHAPLLRSLLDFQEHLLEYLIELKLDENKWNELQAAADKRGWTLEKLVNTLLSSAIRHVDEGTEIGKRIQAHIDKKFLDQDGDE